MPSAPGSMVARVSTMNCLVRVVIGDPEERIIRLQRNKDEAVAALGDEVEAMIEELAEEREPGIERRRQAGVWRHVRE